MAGEHGKNRELDFAYWANLGGKDELTAEETEGLMALLGHHRHQKGMEESDALMAARVQSENLYRVACLLAYGGGLASVCDIEDFAEITEVAVPMNDSEGDPTGEYAEDTLLRVEVTLPYSRWVDDARIPEALSIPKKYHEVINPNEASFLYVEQGANARKGCQTFAMYCYPDMQTSKQEGWYEWPEAYGIIGQVIANAYTYSNYIGVYGGKPLFEARCGFDALWQAMAELADGQTPGICPVCGKVIDRRRGKGGGKPKSTCSKRHSDKFQNTLKKLQKSGNPGMECSNEREEAARQQRWADKSLDERPLKF